MCVCACFPTLTNLTLPQVGISLELSDFQKGLLGTSFMLGYMVFAPIAGYLTAYIRCTRIMSVGLAIFVVAAGCAAISRHFYPLMLSRMLIGFGEATFAGIAPSIIDDIR
jgi:predicted MFS family arabinose efflux permease